ncbi:MAG: RNA methyltransferase [Patescibacteria group bacterium]|nr:RNA methyltransferase [Patescibacteria group bacterium]
MLLPITSLQNPRIKQTIKLRDNKRERQQTDQFVFEGRREIERAMIGKIEIQEIFFCPELTQNDQAQEILKTAEKLRVKLYEIPKHIYAKIALREGTEGMVAVAKSRTYKLEDLHLSKSPLMLIADNIEKPGNLGAMFRVADSVGADAIIITGDKALDPENPNAIRISLGTIFTVPTAICSSEDALKWLRQHKVQIIATTPIAKTIYFEANLKKPTAIIIGSEAWGLNDDWLDKADIQVSMPQKGAADSLNATMAATVVLYEAVRQRRL